MTGRLSKSEVKRQFKRVEEAAKELADFSDRDIAKLPGSDFFHDEIKNTRGLKSGARKRQIKYLAKVMREEPIEDILNHLAAEKGSKIKDNQLFHEAERLRDAIINEAIEDQQECQQEGYLWEPDWESELIPEVVDRYSTLEEDEIRKTTYNYLKSRHNSHYRELFRMIRSAIEYHSRE